jgi:hypothetical protein
MLWFYLKCLAYVAYKLVSNKQLRESSGFQYTFGKLMTDVVLFQTLEDDPKNAFARRMQELCFAGTRKASSLEHGRYHYEEVEKELVQDFFKEKNNV